MPAEPPEQRCPEHLTQAWEGPWGGLHLPLHRDGQGGRVGTHPLPPSRGQEVASPSQPPPAHPSPAVCVAHPPLHTQPLPTHAYPEPRTSALWSARGHGRHVLGTAPAGAQPPHTHQEPHTHLLSSLTVTGTHAAHASASPQPGRTPRTGLGLGRQERRRAQAHSSPSSRPRWGGAESPGSGSFLQQGIEVIDLCLGANSAQQGPWPSPKPRGRPGRVAKGGEDLALFVCLIRTFP